MNLPPRVTLQEYVNFLASELNEDNKDLEVWSVGTNSLGYYLVTVVDSNKSEHTIRIPIYKDKIGL